MSTTDNEGRREPMGMMAWLSTDGGRRCPQCGKFAKPDELGSIGGRYGDAIVSMYGHLPGRGCNKAETTNEN